MTRPVYGSAGQVTRRTQRWYQPEDSWTPRPPDPVPDATVEQRAALWIDPSSQQDRSTVAIWFRPDDDMLGNPTVLPAALGADVLAGLWQEQPGQERSLAPVWIDPSSLEAWVPIPGLTIATLAELAALLPDPSGQQDRSVQPIWYQEPDDTLAVRPTLPVPLFDPAAFPWQFEPEMPARLGFSPDAIEAHFAGPLQAWLFTTGGGGGGGAVPRILVDAETGAVFVFLGGVVIVQAD